MDMVFADIAFDYCHPSCGAALDEQFSKAMAYFTAQYFISVFCQPYEMIFYIMNRKRAIIIIWHRTHLVIRIEHDAEQVKLKADRLKAVVLDLAHGK